MVRSCAVHGCTARFQRGSGRSFHSFPNKPERRQQWILNVSRQTDSGISWQPSKSARVCSDHFRSEEFEMNTHYRILKFSAVPTINVPSVNPSGSVTTSNNTTDEPAEKCTRFSDHGYWYSAASVTTSNNTTDEAAAECARFSHHGYSAASATTPNNTTDEPAAKCARLSDHRYAFSSVDEELEKTIMELTKTKKLLSKAKKKNKEKDNKLKNLAKKLKRRDSKIVVWESDDYRRVRFIDKEKLVNERFAIDYIDEDPIIVVKDRNVIASGGGGALGHPKIFINLDRDEVAICGYSGRKFIQAKYYDAKKHGPCITYEEFLEEEAV